LAVPSQYFDWTKGGRERSFFGNGVAAHVSTAEPVSANMVDWICAGALSAGVVVHRDVTYACVEGPRLGTRAESRFLRQVGCDLVGMTNVPEAFLAREAQLCYATIGIVTDYDCWMDDPSRHVTVSSIFERYRVSLASAASLLDTLLKGPLPAEDETARTALGHAMMSSGEGLTDAQRECLEILKR
jgi:5'-methylthioadenosine phosphorylase